jgi:hypothetical protein
MALSRDRGYSQRHDGRGSVNRDLGEDGHYLVTEQPWLSDSPDRVQELLRRQLAINEASLTSAEEQAELNEFGQNEPIMRITQA